MPHETPGGPDMTTETRTEKQAACRHQYWDLGYCIDCGVRSNDLWNRKPVAPAPETPQR